MKNVSRFLLASILLASTAAFAQIGPPIVRPSPTAPIIHPAPPPMPPRLVSQIGPPVAKPAPTAPIVQPPPRMPPRLVSQVQPPIIVLSPTAPKTPRAPRNPQPTPRLG